MIIFLYGGCSSVGRAPGCGPGGRGFKSLHSPHFHDTFLKCSILKRSHFAPVAQMDRAPDFESVGRRFESCRAYQKNE